MLAEPKHKRARADGLIPAFVQPVQVELSLMSVEFRCLLLMFRTALISAIWDLVLCT